MRQIRIHEPGYHGYRRQTAMTTSSMAIFKVFRNTLRYLFKVEEARFRPRSFRNHDSPPMSLWPIDRLIAGRWNDRPTLCRQV